MTPHVINHVRQELRVVASRLQARIGELESARTKELQSRRFKRGPFNNRQIDEWLYEIKALSAVMSALSGGGQ